jgi:hypothetical protein
LFPNPASKTVTIYLSGFQSYTASATITDLKGDAVISFQIRNKVVKCDLSSLPKGIYLITVVNGTYTLNRKLIHY